MVPNLVFDASGATANMDNGMLLHHFVLFNPAQTGIGCPISEPFFGAGNERTHLHLPTPFGYTNTARELEDDHAPREQVGHGADGQRRDHLPLAAAGRDRADTRPLWLDIDSICSGGDSEYTIPTGYSDTHADWTSPVRRRASSACPATCTTSTSSTRRRARCTARRAARRSRSRPSCVGGSASDYFGPIPPNNPPPADITGATLCSSEAYHGTSFGTANGANGHLDTMSHCGIFATCPRAAQAEAYPTGGALPDRRAIRSTPAR